MSRVVSALMATAFVLLIVGSIASFIGLPYVIMAPGPVYNTLGSIDGHKLITVKGRPTYPATGTLDFTTVSVYGGPGRRVNVFDLARAYLSGHDEIYDVDVIYPKGTTQKQADDETKAQMVSSQEVATATALRLLGQKVPSRAIVAGFSDGSAARGKLAVNDELVSIDGAATPDPDAVRTAVQKIPAGHPAEVVIKRQGTQKSVSVPTKQSGGHTVLGIFVGLDYDLPPITVDAGDVGGPSAGMMFTLGIYDTLTPGSLTGGRHLAGTGEIDTDGTIGAIGGIAQKMVGARDGGASWFLAPQANCSDVVGHVPAGLRVVSVSTIDQALAAVKDIAAGTTSSLATCHR